MSSNRCVRPGVAVVGALVVALAIAKVTTGQPGEGDEYPPAPYPSDHWPSWSPNGQRVTFVSSRGPQGGSYIYELDLTSGLISPVAPWRADADKPSYSPDGTRLVFSWGAGVCLLDTGSGVVSDLFRSSDPGEVGFHPCFRGRDQVLYIRQPRHHKHNGILQSTIDASLAEKSRKVLLTDPQHDISLVAAAPDGHRVAYEIPLDIQIRGTSQLWLWEEGDSAGRLIATLPYHIERLSWFAPGDRLLVSGTDLGTEAIPVYCIVSARDGRIERLRLPPEQERGIYGEMAVSPDGRSVCYSGDSSEGYGTTLWRCGLDGTTATELTHPPAWYYARFGRPQAVKGYDLVYGDPLRDPLKDPR